MKENLDQQVQLDCRGKNMYSDNYFNGDTPIEFTTTNNINGLRDFHNHNTCICPDVKKE